MSAHAGCFERGTLTAEYIEQQRAEERTRVLALIRERVKKLRDQRGSGDERYDLGWDDATLAALAILDLHSPDPAGQGDSTTVGASSTISSGRRR